MDTTDNENINKNNEYNNIEIQKTMESVEEDLKLDSNNIYHVIRIETSLNKFKVQRKKEKGETSIFIQIKDFFSKSRTKKIKSDLNRLFELPGDKEPVVSVKLVNSVSTPSVKAIEYTENMNNFIKLFKELFEGDMAIQFRSIAKKIHTQRLNSMLNNYRQQRNGGIKSVFLLMSWIYTHLIDSSKDKFEGKDFFKIIDKFLKVYKQNLNEFKNLFTSGSYNIDGSNIDEFTKLVYLITPLKMGDDFIDFDDFFSIENGELRAENYVKYRIILDGTIVQEKEWESIKDSFDEEVDNIKYYYDGFITGNRVGQDLRRERRDTSQDDVNRQERRKKKEQEIKELKEKREKDEQEKREKREKEEFERKELKEKRKEAIQEYQKQQPQKEKKEGDSKVKKFFKGTKDSLKKGKESISKKWTDKKKKKEEEKEKKEKEEKELSKKNLELIQESKKKLSDTKVPGYDDFIKMVIKESKKSQGGKYKKGGNLSIKEALSDENVERKARIMLQQNFNEAVEKAKDSIKSSIDRYIDRRPQQIGFVSHDQSKTSAHKAAEQTLECLDVAKLNEKKTDEISFEIDMGDSCNQGDKAKKEIKQKGFINDLDYWKEQARIKIMKEYQSKKAQEKEIKVLEKETETSIDDFLYIKNKAKEVIEAAENKYNEFFKKLEFDKKFVGTKKLINIKRKFGRTGGGLNDEYDDTFEGGRGPGKVFGIGTTKLADVLDKLDSILINVTPGGNCDAYVGYVPLMNDTYTRTITNIFHIQTVCKLVIDICESQIKKSNLPNLFKDCIVEIQKYFKEGEYILLDVNNPKLKVMSSSTMKNLFSYDVVNLDNVNDADNIIREIKNKYKIHYKDIISFNFCVIDFDQENLLHSDLIKKIKSKIHGKEVVKAQSKVSEKQRLRQENIDKDLSDKVDNFLKYFNDNIIERKIYDFAYIELPLIKVMKDFLNEWKILLQSIDNLNKNVNTVLLSDNKTNLIKYMRENLIKLAKKFKVNYVYKNDETYSLIFVNNINIEKMIKNFIERMKYANKNHEKIQQHFIGGVNKKYKNKRRKTEKKRRR